MTYCCKNCGKEIQGYKSKVRTFCSKECQFTCKRRSSITSRECAFCGKEVVRHKYQLKAKNVFCCQEHQFAWQEGKKVISPRPKKKLLTKICLYCNTEFTHWKSAERKYCSQQCAKDSSKKGVVVECAWCRKRYYKLSNRADHNNCCCHEHFNLWRVANRPKSNCEVCEKEFVKSCPSSKSKFCSNECRMKNAADRLPKIRQKFFLKKNNKFEKEVYGLLKTLGYDFEPQFIIGKYCLDIAFPLLKVAVLLDGDYWHANPKIYSQLDKIQKSNKERDIRCVEFLENLGWSVIRIWQSDFCKNSNCLLEALDFYLKRED